MAIRRCTVVFALAALSTLAACPARYPRGRSAADVRAAKRPPPPCVRAQSWLSGGNPPRALVVDAQNAENTPCRVQITQLNLRYRPERGVQVDTQLSSPGAWVLQGGERRQFRFAVRSPARLPQCRAELRALVKTQRFERREPEVSLPLNMGVSCRTELAQ